MNPYYCYLAKKHSLCILKNVHQFSVPSSIIIYKSNINRGDYMISTFSIYPAVSGVDCKISIEYKLFRVTESHVKKKEVVAKRK